MRALIYTILVLIPVVALLTAYGPLSRIAPSFESRCSALSGQVVTTEGREPRCFTNRVWVQAK